MKSIIDKQLKVPCLRVLESTPWAHEVSVYAARKGRVAGSGDGETIISLPRPQDRTNHFRYEHGTEKWNKVGEKPRKSCHVGRRGVLSSSGLSSSFLRSVGGVVAALIRQFIKLRCRVGRAGGTWRWERCAMKHLGREKTTTSTRAVKVQRQDCST